MLIAISSEVQLAIVGAVLTAITTVISAAVAIARIVVIHFDQKWEHLVTDQEGWRVALGKRLDLSDERTSEHFRTLNGTVQEIKDWAGVHEDGHLGLPSRPKMPWDKP